MKYRGSDPVYGMMLTSTLIRMDFLQSPFQSVPFFWFDNFNFNKQVMWTFHIHGAYFRGAPIQDVSADGTSRNMVAFDDYV